MLTGSGVKTSEDTPICVLPKFFYRSFFVYLWQQFTRQVIKYTIKHKRIVFRRKGRSRGAKLEHPMFVTNTQCIREIDNSLFSYRSSVTGAEMSVGLFLENVLYLLGNKVETKLMRVDLVFKMQFAQNNTRSLYWQFAVS